MLRLTGPGKIREILLAPDDAATTFQAVLYNFDIDGDTLKPQHKAWLSEHVVPQLGDSNLRIELRGEASNTGSDAHNLDLSRRRIAHVLNFFHANGPVFANVLVSAVGDADAQGRSEVKGVDDELLRAVIIKVEHSLHRLVPVDFDTNDASFLGFDPGADPPWLMLPAGSIPRIMTVVNAEGLSLVSSNPGVALPQPALFTQPGPVRITQQTQRFRIVPGVTADAEIRAVDARGVVQARLAVSVLPRRTVKCAFHYVQNPRYGTRTRNPGDEADLLDALNSIWGPQANIFFEQVAGNTGQRMVLPMTEDLGDAIDTPAKFDIVGSHRDPSAQFNVFFVREVEGTPGHHDDDDARTIIGPPGDCLFEDDTGFNDRLLICHEAGHCLTLDHNSPIPSTSDMLMNHFVSHSFLPRAHVLPARRAVRR
jgi:hypothetical protein